MSALRRITPYLTPYRKEILLSVVTLTLVVAAELLIPQQIQRVIDEGIAKDNMQVVITSTVFMIGLALLGMVLTFVNTIYAVRVSENFAADVRDAAYRKTQRFSFRNLDNLQTGELLVRLTSDINISKNALGMVLRMVFRAPLMLVGSLVMMVITSPTLALLLVVLLPLTAGMIWWFSRRSGPLFKVLQSKLDRVNTILQENIAGVRVVKAFVRTERENQRFGSANSDYMQQGIKVNQLIAMLFPSMIVLLNLGIVGIIWFGGSMSINGDLTTGEIVAFSNYLLTSMFPVMIMGMILPQLYAAEASLDRILEITDTDPTVLDRPDATPLDPGQVSGRVALEDVTLDYDGSGEPALKGISFIAEPGQTVAILGATGSGKSSLIHLIPRFYDVTSGRVTIDGVDVRDVTQDSLRKAIGVTLQEALLFSGTVRDNIKYGRPDASDEQMIVAAQAAQAHDFIMEKPEGYETLVGQRGTNFSGGQKQRIAIARALCTQPRILILDDSTSAVDVETETKIQDALHDSMQNSTSIIVAQRISTVLNADKIIVLDHGCVAAEGTHETLINTSPIYQEIYHSQLGNGPGETINEETTKEVDHA